jgi:hypothetical protein
MGSVAEYTVLATLLRRIDTIQQFRIEKVKPAFGEKSGIFKIPQLKPIKVRIQGCVGDERD